MASSGDPSTFTFTMDAFPDYTRFDNTKKVLAAIQIIDVAGSMEVKRTHTAARSGDDWANQEKYFD
jgi:peptide subunit release factor RF-3